MFTFAKLCRLCLKNDHFLIDYAKTDLDHISYYDKMMKLNPDLVAEHYENFPTWICVICREELSQFFVFHQKCLKTHELLKKYSKQLRSMNASPVLSIKHIENFTLKANLYVMPIKEEKFNVFNEDTLLLDDSTVESSITIVKNEILFTEDEELNFKTFYKSEIENNINANNQNEVINQTNKSDFIGSLKSVLKQKLLLNSNTANNLIQTSQDNTENSTSQSVIAENKLSKQQESNELICFQKMSQNSIEDIARGTLTFDINNEIKEPTHLLQEEPNLSVERKTNFNLRLKIRNKPVSYKEQSDDDICVNQNCDYASDNSQVSYLEQFDDDFSSNEDSDNILENELLICNNQVSINNFSKKNEEQSNSNNIQSEINEEIYMSRNQQAISTSFVTNESKIDIESRHDLIKSDVQINNNISCATDTKIECTLNNNTILSYKDYIKAKIIDNTNNLTKSVNNINGTQNTSLSVDISSEADANDDFFMDNQFCKICNKKFKHLDAHMGIHKKENNLHCVYCNLEYPDRKRLFTHLRRSHRDFDPCVCLICHKTFENHYILVTHMYSHYGIDVLKCPKCEQLFINSKKMYDHLESIHKNSEFKCLKCKNIYNSPKLVYNHIIARHGSQGTNLCHICGRRFYSIPKLNYHIKSMHAEYMCSICGKKYSKGDNLKMHMQAKHDDITFKCEICSKEFQSKISYYVHKRKHFGKKRFNCNICGKKFLNKIILVNHERTHSGDKPFKCKICDKGFSQKYSLVVHIRTHTGHKPFECKECGKCYSQSYVYKMHMKKHHSNEEIKNS